MKKPLDIQTVDKMKFSKYIVIKVLILYIAILCLGCLSVLVFAKGINTKKEYKFIYEESNNIDYKVYLKQNDYFEEEYLGPGNKYIASLIDNINIDFNYKLSMSDIVDGQYNYYVTATLEAKEKGKEIVIWSKEDIIVEGEETVLNKQNALELTQNISINYEKYNAIMSEFKRAYGVSLDGNLIVALHVETNMDYERSDKPIVSQTVSSLTIPLIEQTLEIELDSNVGNNEAHEVQFVDKIGIRYLLVALGTILFLYYLYLSQRIIRLIFDIYKNQNKYQKRLKKIFSNYDQVIVKVNTLPNTKNKSILEVETFDELLDAQSELREPILYSEIVPDQESIFMITKDDRVFSFKIKYTDFITNKN